VLKPGFRQGQHVNRFKAANIFILFLLFVLTAGCYQRGRGQGLLSG
jgi:hypothetical protein